MSSQLFFKEKKYCKNVIASFIAIMTIFLQPEAPGSSDINLFF